MKLIVQPEAGIVPIVKAIKTATKSIDIMIFRFDRGEIEKALAAAVQRGVTVRALIAHTNRGGEAHLRDLEQRLLSTGVLVSRTADDLIRYHAKYMVADSVLHLFGFTSRSSTSTRAAVLRSRHGIQKPSARPRGCSRRISLDRISRPQRLTWS